ncbi:unnamed protein product [Dracunculus medinensis]|uniref:SEFIR domain-containing protein n=1 Tax=Dracunculus medinensis TaxID=318479 RepID=A0A158Q611_DRAME|nr:unnamed protein product [Dracunculus medinensis]
MPIYPANSKASQWVSAFRKVIVNSITRTIQIEFIGAPSAYCFEEYEIRLKDETGFELLRTATIPVAHMYTEITNNKAVLFGKYIFTNLQANQDYIPSIIPVERARDGRCLCIINGNNPYDNRSICSCIAADWEKVRIRNNSEMKQQNFLIIYTHDCPEHERVVTAFAEFLRQQFNFNIHLDIWDLEEIEINVMDYITKSIINANKILIINSIGTYVRYKNKIDHKYRIESTKPTIFDDLFDPQIDQALRHPYLVSIRFIYTSDIYILPPLIYLLQYTLLDNINLLLSNLSNNNEISFDQNSLNELKSAITYMELFTDSEPLWSDNFTVANHIELNVMNADRNKMTNIVEKDSGVIDDIEDNLNKI